MSQTSYKNTHARRLGPEAKKSIALDVLSGMGITQAARKNAVCRNSVYVQKNKAEAAMDAAFADKTDNTVLFYLPVSTHIIGQVVLALVLIAKASYRDAMQFLHDIFDYPVSIGTVASIVDGACDRAAPINAAYDLRIVKINGLFYLSAKYRKLTELSITQVIVLKSRHFALWSAL